MMSLIDNIKNLNANEKNEENAEKKKILRCKYYFIEIYKF